jgi:hypothetical protein
MWWRPNELFAAALVVAALFTPVPALAHPEPEPACTGAAGIKGSAGEAAAECGSGSVGGGVARECDPDSWDVAYYDAPPPDFERGLVWLRIAGQVPPPEGMRYAAAFNCAGRYLGGPHLVADPAWRQIAAARDAATAQVTPPVPDP